MRLKCPVCVKGLQCDQDFKPESRLQCPYCKSTFRFDRLQAFTTDQDQSKPTPQSVGDRTAVTNNRDRAIIVEAPIIETDQTARGKPQPSESFTADASQIIAHTARAVHLNRHIARRRMWLIGGLFAVACSLLVTVVWVIFIQPLMDDKKPGQNNGPAADHQLAGHSGHSQFDSPTVQMVQKTPEPPAVEPPPQADGDWDSNSTPFSILDMTAASSLPQKPANRFVSKKVRDDCWYRVQAHLVELQAITPAGIRFATGTIIDSRGWVLTSLRAIEGAQRLYVRECRPQTILQNPRLVDEVGGYLVLDIQRDLVVLQVNRRFVTSIEDLEWSPGQQVVAGQYLVQCQPPVAKYPFATVESRVLQIQSMAGLNEPIRQAVIQNVLDDTHARWIQHTSQGPLRWGSLLLAEDCSIVGMNTAAQTNDETLLAISSNSVIEFISQLQSQSSWDNSPLPIPTVLSMTEATSPQPLTSTSVARSNRVQPINARTTLGGLGESLDRLGQECEQFDWWPKTPSQIGTFGEFLKMLHRVHQELSHDLARSDRNVLTKKVAEWSQRLERSFASETSNSLESQIRFNRQFGTLAEEPEMVFASHVFVQYSPMESPALSLEPEHRPRPTVAFKLKGSDDVVIDYLNVDWPPLLPDSSWFIVGTTRMGEVRIKGPTGKRETVRAVKIDFVIPAYTP